MRTTNEANKMPVLHVRIRLDLPSNTTTVSLLANALDVRIVLHRQVSLAAVNHINVFRKVMNSCKNLKIVLTAYFKNVNVA